jgi:hypothetical protein
LLAAAAVACSGYKLARPETALTPFGATPPNFARICVIRTSVIAQAVTYVSRDNGMLVGATRGPTFFCYLAQPGPHRHVVDCDTDEEVAHVDAVASQSFYLKENVHLLGCGVEWVTEGQARALVEDSSYEVLVGVPTGEVVPSNPPAVPAQQPPQDERVSGQAPD